MSNEGRRQGATTPSTITGVPVDAAQLSSPITPGRMTDHSYDRRRATGRAFEILCLGAISIGILALIVLLADISRQGFPTLSWGFITSFPSRFPEQAGIKAALFGTIWLVGLTALVALPTGIAA